MALFEGKTPAERNKLIAALALPLVALLFVGRMLFSSGPAPRPTNANSNRPRQTAARERNARAAADDSQDEVLRVMRPVIYERAVAADSGGGRNIFAFYVPPVGQPRGTTTGVENIPTPTPTPPPPQILASLSPQSVYARTGDFTMQVSGDKFTPETRVYIDGQEQPTQFRGPQQLTAAVRAATLASPGSRTVTTRTPDNALYSNTTVLNVMPPPAPTGVYVGLLVSTRTDTAVIKDQKGELLSVRKGDLIESGRFRVTGISERSVEVVDKELNVKHVLPFVESRAAGAPVTRGPAPGVIQPPQKDDDAADGDDEP